MKLKSIVVSALLATVSFSSSAKSGAEDFCDALTGFAEVIYDYRQDGYTLSQVQKIELETRKKTKDDAQLNGLYSSVITYVYDNPIELRPVKLAALKRSCMTNAQKNKAP